MRHLLKQAPQAILVPEEVRIDLMPVNPNREFDLRAVEENRDPVRRDRIDIASVFVVNRKTVNSWDSNCSKRLPASTIQIPDPLEPSYQPMLFKVVRIYKNHILKD